MSDGPRDEEDGSGGTKEAGTFQTHGDSAQDASPLCRCWLSLIDLLTVVILLSDEHSTGSSVFYTDISLKRLD